MDIKNTDGISAFNNICILKIRVVIVGEILYGLLIYDRIFRENHQAEMLVV